MSPVSSIPAMQRTGLRFPFHVRSAAPQGIQQGHFQTVSLPVGGHLTVSHKMEKLRLSHLSWNVPSIATVPPFSRSSCFLQSLARLSSSTHRRIFNDFTTYFRFISPMLPLISPASNIVSPSSKGRIFCFLTLSISLAKFSLSVSRYVPYTCHA